jgi:hypothetical protein
MIGKLLKSLNAKFQSSEPVQQDIVGVDIAHDYIRTIQLTKSKDQWSLTKISSKSVNGVGHDRAHKDQEILRLLKNCRLEQKFNTTNAAVSLPVSSAIIQVIQIPYLAEDELNAAVENGSLWENTISIPGEFNEYSIFWQVIKKDLDKNQLSILFVASRIDEVEHYCDIVRQAGFEPMIVDVRCFALRNVLKTHEDENPSIIKSFFEISGEENYAVFVYDGLPFIYDIYISDNDLSALKAGKFELESGLFNRIAGQIRSSVEAFLKQSGAAGIEEINLVSSLPNFEIIFEGLKQDIVEYKITPLNPLDHVNIPSQLLSRVQAEKNINLLPNREEVVEKEKVKHETSSKLFKVAIFVSFFMFGLLGIYFYLSSSFPSALDMEELQSREFSAAKELKEIKADLETSKNWLNQVGKLNKKVLNISFLQELPSGVYVVDVFQKRKDPSELSLKATDTSKVSLATDLMSTKFKNVKLLGVESNREDAYQLSKITYQVE